jgi:protein TonB
VFDPNSSVPSGSDLIPIGDPRLGPKPPQPDREKDPVKRLLVGHIEPALLTKRVEPVYPPLAIQIRRAGRVELHAIISSDGSIKSLEVIDGDALFLKSALDAVSQWRYHPTILNGQPVEVDTHITVIYSMPR